MPLRTHRRRNVRPPVVRLASVLVAVLAVVAALATAWAGTAAAAPATAEVSRGVDAATSGSAVTSWQEASAAAVVIPPHDSSRGSCTPTRIGAQIRLDCLILKPDTTLWVACSGGFVEIRHISEGMRTAQGTCPQYGGYALTATSGS